MSILKNSLFIAGILGTISCNTTPQTQTSVNENSTNEKTFHTVNATIQTTPVSSDDDAADDPSIWIHPENRENSILITTNKKNGVDLYDLNGNLLNSQPFGKLNNIDVRYNFVLGDDTIDIAAASNRTTNSISIFKIDADSRKLKDISARVFPTDLEEVYGFCLYKDVSTYRFYANVVSKEGKFEQFELLSTDSGKIDLKSVRRFDLSSQAEGMVADDELGNLFIAEENVGLWKYNAHPDSGVSRTLIDTLHGKNKNNSLAEDLEGVSIYYAADKKGYLIVSSQGNNSYAVYDRNGDNKYIGSFEIANGNIDGTEDTDGLDVINMGFGSLFPNGFFIAQDGANTEQNDTLNQNFKLVPWESIASELNLIQDKDHNVRL